jgi:hypothetical protein
VSRLDNAIEANCGFSYIGGRVLFVLELAVSLLRRGIDGDVRDGIDGVPSGLLAEGDTCVHCCGYILGVAVFRGR